MIVVMESPRLYQRDCQALSLMQRLFRYAIIWLVMIMWSEADFPDYIVLVGNSQSVAAFGTESWPIKTIVLYSDPVRRTCRVACSGRRVAAAGRKGYRQHCCRHYNYAPD